MVMSHVETHIMDRMIIPKINTRDTMTMTKYRAARTNANNGAEVELPTFADEGREGFSLEKGSNEIILASS